MTINSILVKALLFPLVVVILTILPVGYVSPRIAFPLGSITVGYSYLAGIWWFGIYKPRKLAKVSSTE